MTPPTIKDFVQRFEDQMFGMAMFGVIRGNDDPSWKNRTDHMRHAPEKVRALLEDMYRFLHSTPVVAPESPVVPTVPNRMPTNGVPGTNGLAQARR